MQIYYHGNNKCSKTFNGSIPCGIFLQFFFCRFSFLFFNKPLQNRIQVVSRKEFLTHASQSTPPYQAPQSQDSLSVSQDSVNLVYSENLLMCNMCICNVQRRVSRKHLHRRHISITSSINEVQHTSFLLVYTQQKVSSMSFQQKPHLRILIHIQMMMSLMKV